MIELRKLMLNTLHLWIAAHHRLIVSTFADFLNLCSSLACYYGSSLYTLYVLGLRPSELYLMI
jgi:hypothetical protein